MRRTLIFFHHKVKALYGSLVYKREHLVIFGTLQNLLNNHSTTTESVLLFFDSVNYVACCSCQFHH